MAAAAPGPTCWTGSAGTTYASSDSGVTVNLATGVGQGGSAEGDTLSGIEDLRGSAWDDVLVGSSVQGDVDGDGAADFQIQLIGAPALVVSDLIL